MPANQRNPRVQRLQHRDRVQHQLQTVFGGWGVMKCLSDHGYGM